jgi:hypothetical protein
MVRTEEMEGIVLPHSLVSECVFDLIVCLKKLQGGVVDASHDSACSIIVNYSILGTGTTYFFFFNQHNRTTKLIKLLC